MSNESAHSSRRQNRGLRALGPAIIVASVVLGPGSILTASKVGAQFGYSMAWVLVLAGLLMTGMVVLAGRLGVLMQGTICDELTTRIGRPFSAAIGIMLFLVVASFQSSNNIAVVTAIEPFLSSAAEPSSDDSRTLPVAILLLLNGVIVAALYGLKKLYVPIEQFMKLLVAIMIVGFAGNVFFARPSIVELLKGLVPSIPPDNNVLTLLGLVATTFSVGGAFYQGYLVREKGWTSADLGQGLLDSTVGIAALCGTTMVIMMTSAAVFHGQDVKLESAVQVGEQLEPLFGKAAKVLFSLGLLAGAISSFMVNAMVGGAVMADGFGLGWSMDQKWPKAFTVLALAAGMFVGIAATAFDVSRVSLIIFAQSLTVVGVPLLAFSLLYLGIKVRSSHPRQIPLWLLVLAGLGTLMTFILAFRTVDSLIE